MLSRPSMNPSIEPYQRYRKAAMTLNQKMIEAFVDSNIIEQAARALDLGRNRQLLLDSEDDLSVLMDFALYEIRRQNMNLVERYQQERGGDDPVERELLTAMVRAKAGLFKVKRVSRQSHRLKLLALEEENRIIVLTDINFSQTVVGEPVFFFRPIELAEFAMTSGIAFIFPGEIEQELVGRWRQLHQAGRYARFFKLSKHKGIATSYVEDI